jgi:hypothetical protein
MRERQQNVIAGPAAWRGPMLIGPYERRAARNHRLAIYAAIYSIAALVGAGKLLFWWLQ